MNRHQSRILAMQALCQYEVLGESLIAQLNEFLTEEKPPTGISDHARGLVNDALTHADEIDRTIQESASNWELKRIAPVDRNILRVAVCELLFRKENPPRVTVNEAVDLGKEYGSAESGGFINGVLDAILRKLNTSEDADPHSPAGEEPGRYMGATDGTI